MRCFVAFVLMATCVGMAFPQSNMVGSKAFQVGFQYRKISKNIENIEIDICDIFLSRVSVMKCFSRKMSKLFLSNCTENRKYFITKKGDFRAEDNIGQNYFFAKRCEIQKKISSDNGFEIFENFT
jgi:hypothetical protein